jgi:uncharacterized protein YndB with AHSA1/START domain
MTRQPTATGRKDPREDGWLVFTRTFRAPVEDVWAAVTDPVRLDRWIGTWTGDPDSGEVRFAMTAEGEDAPAELCRIEACTPPHLLAVTTVDGEGTPWRLRLELAEADGVTTLDFSQQLSDPGLASSVGPGWDYYLDRLVAVETGEDINAVSFDDYYPALSGHYTDLVS